MCVCRERARNGSFLSVRPLRPWLLLCVCACVCVCACACSVRSAHQATCFSLRVYLVSLVSFASLIPGDEWTISTCRVYVCATIHTRACTTCIQVVYYYYPRQFKNAGVVDFEDGRRRGEPNKLLDICSVCVEWNTVSQYIHVYTIGNTV